MVTTNTVCRLCQLPARDPLALSRTTEQGKLSSLAQSMYLSQKPPREARTQGFPSLLEHQPHLRSSPRIAGSQAPPVAPRFCLWLPGPTQNRSFIYLF